MVDALAPDTDPLVVVGALVGRSEPSAFANVCVYIREAGCFQLAGLVAFAARQVEVLSTSLGARGH